MIAARRARRVAFALSLLVAPAHGTTVAVPGTPAKVDVTGYVDGLAVPEIGGPRQRPQLRSELSLLGKITRNLRTQLTLRGTVGGPFERGHPGIMSLVHEFQNHTPSAELNEAWAELRLGDAQIRAGIQKFAWGKLDGAPPTDVLTPRDLHDPIVRDIEESKIGIPAIALDYFLPSLPAIGLSEPRVSVVYVPMAVPSRIALVDERWFPPSIDTGGLAVTKQQADAALAENGLEDFTVKRDFTIPIALRPRNARPPTTFDAGGIAVRLAGTIRQVDWSLSHYTGPETGPNIDLVASAICRDCLRVFDDTGLPPVRARSVLLQAHDMIHMSGGDFSTTLGGATMRGEVAVFQNRPYLRISREVVAKALSKQSLSDIVSPLIQPGPNGKNRRVPVPLPALFPDRDSVEWGLGVDYLIGGFLPLLQVNQVIFTDDGPEQLLSNPETRLLASVRKAFFQDTLELELRGVYAFERGSWFVYPRASYRFGDNVRLRLGYLAIGGEPESVIGQFRDNDQVVLEARYSY